MYFFGKLATTYRMLVYTVLLLLLLYTCVTIRAPDGGPKDTTAPKLGKVWPTHESVNFKGKRIRLTFDKKIQVKNLYNKLVISPRLPNCKGKRNYTYQTRGKDLYITLTRPLAEDTTYTFQFNDAIQDCTEGNVAENIVLTFSTGEQLDAMCIAGQVIDHLTHQSQAQVRVGLYHTDRGEGMDYLKETPDYITQTDQEGNFTFNHIKKGLYYLYAREKLENNFNIDFRTEKYGFVKDPIDVTRVSDPMVISTILQADIRDLAIIRQQPNQQYFEIELNKPIKTYTLTSPQKKPLDSHLIKNKTIIRVYNTQKLLAEDTLLARLKVTDEAGNTLEEIIKISFRPDQAVPLPLQATLHPPAGRKIKSTTDSFKITWNKPLKKQVVTDQCYFVLLDSDQHKKQIPLSPQDIQLSGDVVTIKRNATSATTETSANGTTPDLTLHLGPGAFVAVDGEKSKAAEYNYSFKKAQEGSTLQGKIITEAPDFILQLLNEKFEVVDELRNAKTYTFEDLAAGNYHLRAFVPSSPDGVWSFGNMYQRKEPDLVFLYPQKIAVIENWKMYIPDFVF